MNMKQKRVYERPATTVVRLQSSKILAVSGDLGITNVGLPTYGGANTGIDASQIVGGEWLWN